ncbi:MAG: hypothetical protein HYV24_11585 [Deltaproteobacteria bacterium]|nr:hypothetical protein [Deltaproteobacteria bacterium]
MKRRFAIAITVLCFGFIATAESNAVDTYIPGQAASGIGSSRHNLGYLPGRAGNNYNSAKSNFTCNGCGTGTSEICVFCHTPHHTNTANNLKPMWNRGTSAPTSFTAYGTTIGGTTVVNTDIGSTTLACLSCHDGVTTFDNIVNAPGKGGVTAGGSDRGYVFSDYTGIVSDFMVSARVNIGLDLTNDHPVSVVYNAGAVAGLRSVNTTISAIDLTSDLNTSATTYDNGNLTKNYWAVKGFISDTATIADLLRNNRVECSSCHDPHFNNKSWNEIDPTYALGSADLEFESNGLFIRRVGGNTGSGVCRTCHEK